MRSRSGLGGRAAIGALFVLALLAAAITVTVAHVAFPHGSADLDEVAYVSQANALRQHELTLPAATHDPFFRPFLSGVRGDRIVSKYQPEWPALIAASDGLFGSTLPLRALMAIGGVLATAWFAWELVRDRRVVVAATILVVASPFTWMQTASLLGYQLSFVLGTATAAALVRSSRGATAANGITAGALLGLAVFHRPFDALLATAPVLAYWCWFAVRRRRFVRSAGWVALGGMPFAGLLLAYNRAATGSLFHLVYNVTGPSDAFGFGWRASFAVPGGGHEGQLHYTIGEAFWALRHLFLALPRFVAFGPVVAVFAGIALWSRLRDLRAWLLAAMVMIVVVGYFFWWGVANSYHYQLDRSLGPFYYYPLLAPLCVLAAWGLMLVHRSLVVAIVTGAIAIAWGGVASTVVVRDGRAAGRARTAELQELRAPGPSLVLQSQLFPNYPYLRVATDAKLRDAHLVAVDAPDRRLELIDRFPGRGLYLVRTYRRFDDFLGPEQRDRIELHVVRGRAIRARVRGTITSGHAGRVYLRIGDEAPRFLMAEHGNFDTTIALPAVSLATATAATPIAVGVTVADAGEPPRADLRGDWLECGTTARRTTDGDVEVLQICDGRHHYPFPNHAAVVEDVSPALRVEFAAS